MVFGDAKMVVEASGEAWATGSRLAYMKALAEHWCRKFDWRAQEPR